jgi:hypothetical protein
MDIYIPHLNMDLEFNGPSHYYEYTREETSKTKLRSLLSGSQGYRVKIVPYYEFDNLSHEDEEAYIKNLLNLS